jgi:hypothetical protein
VAVDYEGGLFATSLPTVPEVLRTTSRDALQAPSQPDLAGAQYTDPGVLPGESDRRVGTATVANLNYRIRA